MDKDKRGLFIVLAALLAVLGLGFAGYQLLSGKAEEGLARANAEATRKVEGGTDDASTLAERDATVYTELGDPVTLTSLAQGKPMVINFWATWCPYCIKELPEFKQIYGEYGDRVVFAFIDVCDGEREKKEDAIAWLAENGFAELPDYYDSNLDAARAFGASTLPLTAIVDPGGKIVSLRLGVIDASYLRGALNSIV